MSTTYCIELVTSPPKHQNMKPCRRARDDSRTGVVGLNFSLGFLVNGILKQMKALLLFAAQRMYILINPIDMFFAFCQG